MYLHQNAYTEQIIKRFEMIAAKTVEIPADLHMILEPVIDNSISTVSFREAVGSLLFLATVSRRDISYAVNSVSRFLSNYNDSHWRAVKRIIRYLKGTINLVIVYGKGIRNPDSDISLKGYFDSDYASDLGTRRSTTGYIFILTGGPITWGSQRQKMVRQKRAFLCHTQKLKYNITIEYSSGGNVRI